MSSRKQKSIEQAYGAPGDRGSAHAPEALAEEGAERDEEAVEAPQLEPTGAEPETTPIDSVSEPEGEQARIAELEAEIAELASQVEAERQQFLRTMADFQNFRRRHEEQSAEIRRFATKELVLGLLPILDNFERALSAGTDPSNHDKLLEGVSLTGRQIGELLTKSGVEPIQAIGEQFDPNFHDAVMRVEDGEHPPNTVVEELQRGYTMHKRVLRPSIVKVAAEE